MSSKEDRVRVFLPRALGDFPFRIDMALQDPRPLNPLKMGDRQIYVCDSSTKRVSEQPLPRHPPPGTRVLDCFPSSEARYGARQTALSLVSSRLM